MAWAYWMGLPKFRETGGARTAQTTHEGRGTAPWPWSTPPGQSWDGLVRVGERAQAALGLTTARVEPQTEPIRLEVLGTTKYMTDFQTTIRPMFKGRADKVHVVVGQPVETGDPLIDIYSAELAEAKSDFEVRSVHWTYYKSLLERHEELFQSRAVSTRVYEETKSDEMKSRVEAKVARDKLRLYGLNDAEIARIKDEDREQKARLTLRAPACGAVICRDAVPGNLYDANDTLLVIAPLDRLWVWGHVFESDIDQVRLGQPWQVRFPHLDLSLRGTIEHISTGVDPRTHTVRIRTSVPNPGGRLKSDMLVRGMLELPPLPGRVVIPRSALIVADGPDYVFVRVSGSADAFERRTVRIAHERNDHIIIDEGLRAGEEVVCGGSLILAQAYVDLRMGHADAPPAFGKDGASASQEKVRRSDGA
jgi:cobalt-zinc-cadmium efflux system membrane fusion protein